VIDTASIPLRGGASIDQALSEGDDYELLFTTSKLPEHKLVSVIGRVVSRTTGSQSVINEHGDDLSTMGWEHA
jgi:thiamine monophosphate kinase